MSHSGIIHNQEISAAMMCKEDVSFWQLDLISLTGRPVFGVKAQSLGVYPPDLGRSPVIDRVGPS